MYDLYANYRESVISSEGGFGQFHELRLSSISSTSQSKQKFESRLRAAFGRLLGESEIHLALPLLGTFERLRADRE